MHATLSITLPDGTVRTVELDQVTVQTSYSTEFLTQPQPAEPLQPTLVSRITLTGAIVSGSLVG
jgi:hypothetical protein